MNPPAEPVRMRQSFQCRLCRKVVVTPELSLGRLPVCNGFTSTGTVDRIVDLGVVECETCRLVQLYQAPSIDAIVPRLPWISYREPEGHLDALVAAVLAFRPDARTALGTGPFEPPLLSRLAVRGIATATLDCDATPSEGRYPYLESWQASLNAPRLAGIAARMGTFDLVCCRYLAEHAPDPVAAIRALRHMLNPDGLVLIEVPDSSKFLRARDYALLWEEHVSYFEEGTLRRLAEMAGYRVAGVLRFPGELEDALVAVLEVTQSPHPPLAPQGTSERFRSYLDDFAHARSTLKARLARAAGPDKNRIALFGIGHQAIIFVNAFGIADEIAMAVDDNPAKAGLFPPGFRTPVVSSEQLIQDGQIRTCLFAVAPNTQAKVQVKLSPMVVRGVEFRSIYAPVDGSIMKDLA
jgi:SAM-dependent methyltransferase